MNPWPEVTLTSVCTKIQDGAHRSPQRLHDEPGPGRYPYLTSKNVRTSGLKLDKVQYCEGDFHDDIYRRCNPELGDVLLTKDGANTGQVAINSLDTPFSLLSSVCLLKPDRERLLPGFLHYYLQSGDGFSQITGKMTGAAIKRIILKTIKSSRMPLPSLAEQGRIVAILDEAMQAIDTATHNTQQNQTNAQELSERLADSCFAPPDDADWPRSNLGDLAEFKNGLNFTKSSDGQLVSIVGVKDFKTNLHVPTDELATVQVDDILSEAYELRQGDILTVRSNGNKQLIGRAMLMGKPNGAMSHSGFTIRIRVSSDSVSPEYLVRYLRSGTARERLISGGIGTNISSLNQGTLAALQVPLPAIEEQRVIVERADALQLESTNLYSACAIKESEFDALRQSLLQKAFSGELSAEPKAVDRVLDGVGV